MGTGAEKTLFQTDCQQTFGKILHITNYQENTSQKNNEVSLKELGKEEQQNQSLVERTKL